MAMEIARLGELVSDDFCYDSGSYSSPRICYRRQAREPQWIRGFMGDEFSQEVPEVEFGGTLLTADGGLANFQRLRDEKILPVVLAGTKITDGW